MASSRAVLLSMLCLAPRLAAAAGGGTTAIMHENFTEYGYDEGGLGESVSTGHNGGSVSGFTDVGVHQGSCVGYAWPGGDEGQFQRSELYSSWNDLVRLNGGPTDTPAMTRAIVNIASAHSIDGDVGPKGAGSDLHYAFKVSIDGASTTMSYDRFVFQAPGSELLDDPSASGGTFQNGALVGTFEIPYGHTVRFQSDATPWASENASVAITGAIGIRFEIPPGSTLVSLTPGVDYETTVPEPSAVASAGVALLALRRAGRRARAAVRCC